VSDFAFLLEYALAWRGKVSGVVPPGFLGWGCRGRRAGCCNTTWVTPSADSSDSHHQLSMSASHLGGCSGWIQPQLNTGACAYRLHGTTDTWSSSHMDPKPFMYQITMSILRLQAEDELSGGSAR
jgi:hypothetical protein